MDVYRGFVMLLMMAEALQIATVASAFPDSLFWRTLGFHTSHVEWVGCSLHDMIQPSFSFLVGVALPFSIASRIKRGQAAGTMAGHALWRSLLLVLLGVFLRSVGAPETNWTFEDTLTQIGLGYPFLFALGFTNRRVQFATLVLILAGYWLAWAIYPMAPPWHTVTNTGMPLNWAHDVDGFAGHWNKHSNLGVAFDQWFLNLFLRSTEDVTNAGGYLTLNFIPTLGTMLLGLSAGRWLRNGALPAKEKLIRLLASGAVCILLGTLLHLAGICPVVKRIWTPSWVLASGGICFLFMAAFYAAVDVKGWKRWSFPLVVIGMNSIAAYLISHLWGGFIGESFLTHLGVDVFKISGDVFAPLLLGTCVLMVFWLVLFWMYRRRLFLRI